MEISQYYLSMKTRVFWLFCLVLLLLPRSVYAVSTDTLKRYLTVEAAILGANDNFSLYFTDMDGAKTLSFSPTRSWIPASTVKAYVLVEVFNQVRQGLISFDKVITIDGQNVVANPMESDAFPRLREGTTATIRQLAEAMIIQSDNTAYNTLLDVLNRRNITATLRSLGITETVVGEKLNLDDTQYSADQNTAGYQPNTTTAKDFAQLFTLLAQNRIPGSADMLAIFKRQIFNDMIPAFIPKSVAVAHKTGFWAPIYHDGGVVYKPDEPFVLTIFTNANDPTITARLAKVAYYQDADSVSLSLAPERPIARKNTSYPTITLAKIPSDQETSKVLAAATQLPQVTAADLGITTKDLTIESKDVKTITPAIITPKALLYSLKTGFEQLRLRLSAADSQRADAYLDMARARLSEIKAVKNNGDATELTNLMSEAQSDLRAALNLAKNSPNPDSQLTSIKAISDLSFATTGENLDKIHGADKEKAINQIYVSYQTAHKDIDSQVQKLAPTSPFNQPLIGTIKEANGNQVTVEFSDSTTKVILISKNTSSRSFREKNTTMGNQMLTIGDKIAVVGKTASDGKIISNFILRDIPKEIPEKKDGVVVKIDPQNQSLDIKNAQGQVETVSVDKDTMIRGKDTGVSLEGIKAGSAVTVYSSGTQTTTATTITVTKNSSGKNEKTEKKKDQHPKKEEKKSSGRGE